MGLLDGLLGELAGSLAGNDPRHAGLVNGVLGMLTHPQGGGIGGLLAAFQAGGLGHVVESWISTGANLPVSAQQLEQVLGSARIAELAKGAGLTPAAAGPKLAELLPLIVDRLTPNGVVSK